VEARGKTQVIKLNSRHNRGLRGMEKVEMGMVIRKSDRPKTNAVILLDMGHTLRRECAREE
jgi:hypothetical protein